MNHLTRFSTRRSSEQIPGDTKVRAWQAYHPPCPRSSPLEKNTVLFGSHSRIRLTASPLVSRYRLFFWAGTHDRWRRIWEEQLDASPTDGHTVAPVRFSVQASRQVKPFFVFEYQILQLLYVPD